MSRNINDYIRIPSAPLKVVAKRHPQPQIVPQVEAPEPPKLMPSYADRLEQSRRETARTRMATVPAGVPTTPYRATPQIELPEGMGELPLFSKDDPNSKKLQERLIAKVKIFDLTDPDQVVECQKVWQMVCDGVAYMSTEKVVFDEKNAKYLMLLRWSEISYKLPGS